MNANESEIRSGLERLTADVSAGRIGQDDPWGGADVIVSDKAPPPSKSDSFYPDKRTVVTPYAREMGWLFVSLRDVFQSALDHQNKLEFFGRLADAVEAKQSEPNASAKEVCLAVLAEAESMVGKL